CVMGERKKLLLFAAKLGYQTRSLDEAAQRLGVDVIFVTDRCHQLDDPWGDRAIAVHFESPEVAAYSVMEAVRKLGPDGEAATIDGILAFGDRPAGTAAYVARGLGVAFKHRGGGGAGEFGGGVFGGGGADSEIAGVAGAFGEEGSWAGSDDCGGVYPGARGG